MKAWNNIIVKCEGIYFRIYVLVFCSLFFKKKYKKVNGLHIKSICETVDELVSTDKSMGRYGDGELSWMIGKNNGFNNFQNKSKTLSNRLLEVFNNDRDDFIITLPDAFRKESSLNFTKGSFKFWKYYITKRFNKISGLLNYRKDYYNTSVTRPYIDYNLNKFAEKSFRDLREVWNDKNILIIEGNQSRLGYSDDLFDNCSGIKRIECPATNAFEIYDNILDKATSFLKTHNDYITLISLGPTATILAYDLCCEGYKALDLGHIDVEYEWYLIGAKEKINLPDKYVNEVSNGKEAKVLVDNSHDDEIIYKF